jgi:hypothetical protein
MSVPLRKLPQSLEISEKCQTKWQSHDPLIDNFDKKKKKTKNANQQKFLAENSSLCPSIPTGASAIPEACDGDNWTRV